jgi:signal transduction histidine kinase
VSTFTVDTHLFRELGQLLVGRDSTALVELVKNAYDADATEVIVHGEYLSDPQRGIIRIQDNGVGMTEDDFRRGFLRIASRMKEQGARLSPSFGRRFTGAKGIGRLAAHKLARLVEIDSVPAALKGRRSTSSAVAARIDWDKIEEQETLDQLEGSDDAVHIRARAVSGKVSPGTTIILRRLRQRWSDRQLGGFLAEIEQFQPPRILIEPPVEGLIEGPPLFQRARIARTTSEDPGCTVRLEGAFAAGESYWPALAQAANWLLEIDADSSRVRYAIHPLRRLRDEFDEAETAFYERPHPAPDKGPFFHARVLVREGTTIEHTVRTWARHAAGIRVFMEGFRVLPYGEPTDDWLDIDRDTTERTRALTHLDPQVDALFPAVKDEGLLLLPRKHYFGAVFLTQEDAPHLAMLVNREGFVPDEAFTSLRELIRLGVDLMTRVRAGLRSQVRDRSSEVPRPQRKVEVENAFVQLEKSADDLRQLTRGLASANVKRVEVVIGHMERAARLSREYFAAESMTRVLASLGLQYSAFTHEMGTVLNMARTVETSMARLVQRANLPPQGRAELRRIAGHVGELRRVIERQAAHLTDIVAPDVRRRRTRQKVSERFQAAIRFVQRALEEHAIEVRNDIDPELRSPPMFAAELTSVLVNLVTNAVKAAGKNGRIRASSAARPDGTAIIRLENSGVAVDPETAEKWFVAFKSTTVTTDSVLGQGMGLGLTITRDILSEIGASIGFVTPRRGYATAIQIVLPK